MEFENILYSVERGRARITLNRPERLNALSADLQAELNAALWRADRDREVHCVILSGAGRAFSAGYDIYPSSGAQSEDDYGSSFWTIPMQEDVWHLERQQRDRMAIWDMHKPVIARVHGYCLAGGTDLALICDIVVASEDAVIGYPPVRSMGSPPAHMWTYLAGPQWAKRLLLTGDSISGADAAQIGLVYKAVPADALDTEVESLADKMAMIDVGLLSANKRSVNLALEMMGARNMQRLAAELDARGHHAPSVAEFGERSQRDGLRAALEWRDSKFGDGRASPEYQQRREQAQQQPG
ncbi:MAG: crotonase/enoyl-CoA hydratase family protein [Dehalococcoidia bacterium]|nr:crotonase/enoyl-CoA hydratase family protein [Dehalococcoidia bacterium]